MYRMAPNTEHEQPPDAIRWTWNAYSRFKLALCGFVVTLGGTGAHVPVNLAVENRRWCFALSVAELEIRAPEPSNDVIAWGVRR